MKWRHNMMDELPTCDGCGEPCHNNSRICTDCQTPDEYEEYRY